MKELSDRNVGGRGEGIFDKTMHGLKMTANNMGGNGGKAFSNFILSTAS